MDMVSGGVTSYQKWRDGQRRDPNAEDFFSKACHPCSDRPNFSEDDEELQNRESNYDSFFRFRNYCYFARGLIRFYEYRVKLVP